jgi:F0F1-type ATP synthase membrane subunit b/b'
MQSERPDLDQSAAHDPAGRIVDDKMAEARERIDRIEKSAGEASPGAQQAAPEKVGMEAERTFEKSLQDLEAASRDLKARITEEKRRHDMPIDSSLGDPEVEARNADGRNDLPDVDDQ